VARAIARGIEGGNRERRGFLALLFTLGGPLFFVFSFSEMTELPFALVLGAAVLCYQRKWWAGFALLAGLLPTARPEGFGLVVLAGAALVLHRRWMALGILMSPLLAWDVAGWLIMHRAGPWYAWLLHAWPWSKESLYGRGSIFTFAAAMPLIVSPLVLPATIVGIWKGIRPDVVDGNDAPRCPWTHANVNRLMIVLIPLGILALHSVLRWLGRFGSFGEARYLLVAAPLWGVLSAQGWEWVFERLRWRHAGRWAVAAICFPILVNVVYPMVPIGLEKDWQAAARFAGAYRERGGSQSFPRVIASHPGVHYFLGIDPNAGDRVDAFTGNRIASPTAGTILVWDPIYSSRNASVEDATTLAAIVAAGWVADLKLTSVTNGMRDKFASADDPSVWHVFRSGSTSQ
jgi:hypothetical protein